MPVGRVLAEQLWHICWLEGRRAHPVNAGLLFSDTVSAYTYGHKHIQLFCACHYAASVKAIVPPAVPRDRDCACAAMDLSGKQ